MPADPGRLQPDVTAEQRERLLFDAIVTTRTLATGSGLGSRTAKTQKSGRTPPPRLIDNPSWHPYVSSRAAWQTASRWSHAPCGFRACLRSPDSSDHRSQKSRHASRTRQWPSMVTPQWPRLGPPASHSQARGGCLAVAGTARQVTRAPLGRSRCTGGSQQWEREKLRRSGSRKRFGLHCLPTRGTGRVRYPASPNLAALSRA